MMSVNDLSPNEMSDFAALLDEHNRRIFWEPIKDRPQQDAFECPAHELLYGGAAGGGKTDLLLGLAIRCHQRSIIYRRQYPQLEAIIQRSRELLPYRSGAKFNATKNLWFLPGHRFLEFGAVQYEEDVEKYQGRPHDFKGFDELTHFTKRQYILLSRGWLRTTDPVQRLRIVATSNPALTDEGMWVREHWAAWLSDRHPNPAKPGELRWYIMVENEQIETPGPEPVLHNGVLVYPMSRTFIPARLADNPYLASDERYLTSLQALPEPIRSRLLYGDWTAGSEDSAWQVIPSAWVRAAQERWTGNELGPQTALGVDIARGGNDQTVLAPVHGNIVVPLHKYPGATTPDGPTVAALVVGALQPGARANLDVIGVGASAYDMLAAGKYGSRIYGINFGAGSARTDRSGLYLMRNVRAAAWWCARELLDPDLGANIVLPPDSELYADLVAPRYSVVAGRIVVEPKEDVARRLGRSPDCGDAVVLGLWDGGGMSFIDYLQSEYGDAKIPENHGHTDG